MSVPSDIISVLDNPPRDPSNDAQPNYALPEHNDAIQKEMESENCEEAQARTFLGYMWRREHARQMAAWEHY